MHLALVGGAYWEKVWFQVSWRDDPNFNDAPIAAKELLPILVAAVLWGAKWKSALVCCHCDNEAVVQAINGEYCRQPDMAHMLRCLFFIEAKYQVCCTAKHLPGAQNRIADALPATTSACSGGWPPEAKQEQAAVSQELVQGLTAEQPWTSPAWSKWFTNIVED